MRQLTIARQRSSTEPCASCIPPCAQLRLACLCVSRAARYIGAETRRDRDDSMLRTLGVALIAGLTFAAPALAVDAPAEIKIGTLYASSGRYASISMPVHYGLKLWAEQKNAAGGD